MDINKIAVFTISSKNYFSMSKTFLDSVKKYNNQDLDLYLFLADENSQVLEIKNISFTVKEVKSIGIPNFKRMAFQYDVMEFNTAVKPFCFKYLFDQGYSKVLYFDPDIMVFDSLYPLFKELDKSSIILTPHITEPLPEGDTYHPSEQVYLRAGTYNLGFIGVSCNDEGKRFVDWWGNKCANFCFNEVETGLFVDQKWVNLISGFFSELFVFRNKSMNMAYWNLHERFLDENYIVNKKESLVFYHFSGIDVFNIEPISKYQNRYDLKKRPDLRKIFQYYSDTVIKNGYKLTCKLPYFYDTYSDGKKIGPFARRYYSLVSDKFDDPFSIGKGSYREFLEKKGLLEKKIGAKPTISKFSKQIKIANYCLKILAKIIGIDRYNNLMIYLRNMCVIRRQYFWH